MQRVKKFLEAYLCSLVAMLVTIISLSSCNRLSGDTPQPSTDSTYIAQTVEAYFNPSFASVAEVLNFQNLANEECSIDEVFRSLSENIITNVATVCLNKQMSATKRDIVEEYRANKSVYDNLENETAPNQDQPQENNPATVLEGQQTPVPLSVSYRYEVDTINGQPVRVLIKEERYESE